MEATQWITLLVQVPLVGVFIWYSITTQKMNQESMEKRDKAYLDAIAAVTRSIDQHDDKVDKHHSEIKTQLAIMDKR